MSWIRRINKVLKTGPREGAEGGAESGWDDALKAPPRRDGGVSDDDWIEVVTVKPDTEPGPAADDSQWGDALV
ncbi:MAG: hypothetical protein O2905_08190, partial [Proteobacteria bacterium]|nr:hypothetical protein [Pseudomonadota bacterium]